MWIVRMALRHMHTFVVVALMIAVLGAVSVYRMSTDIFPSVNIPVVSVVWQYTGMPADQIETRIILVNERVLTASVNGIEHIESQSLDGVGVIRIYFQPGAQVADGEAQVTATCQTLLKVMPPGITPPYIVQYSATSVPIVQIAVSSDTLTEQQIFDYAQNFIIQQLGTVQGARVPQPYGGKQRQVMVELDTNQLYARGLSPQEAATAVLNQNPIIPAGPAKIGDTEYDVKLNSSPDTDPGVQLPARPDGQRRAGLRQGRGPRAGRVRGADQRRPPRRTAGRADDRAEGRGRVHHQRGPAASRGHAGHPGPAAAGTQDGISLRPVGVRPGGRPGRAARRAPSPPA